MNRPINGLKADSSLGLAGAYSGFELIEGVERVAEGHKVRGPKGRERGWGS